MYHYGNEGNYNILIMELMGNSLDKLFKKLNRKFSLKSILIMIDQTLKILEIFHSHNYIHRDIKPDNFVIGLGAKTNSIHLLDFGLSKRFRNKKSGLHIPYRDHKSFLGTARYASLRTHLGVEQSRRDDIEAMIYVVIYLLKGKLPWQGISTRNREEKYRMIKEIKLQTSIANLCEGLPSNN